LAQKPRTAADRGDTDRLRLRDDFDQLRREHIAMQAIVTRLDSTPIDVGKLSFSGRVVVALVLMVTSIIGGMYGATYGIRTTQNEIIARMDERDRLEALKQKITDKQADDITKQFEALNKVVAEVVREQRLQQINIEKINLEMAKQGVRR
jgi:hypothetical protein